jgi:putative transposase
LSERHLLLAYRYIARNPVVAQMCKRPQDWAWSSYAATVGLAPALSFVDATPIVRAFGDVVELALGRLRTFVEES